MGNASRELAPSVCGRIPVRLNREHRYVDHRFQVMPKSGFTALFDRMLRHRKIRVLLDCDFEEVRRLIVRGGPPSTPDPRRVFRPLPRPPALPLAPL